MIIFGSKMNFHENFTSKIFVINFTEILVKINFTEISVISTEINNLGYGGGGGRVCGYPRVNGNFWEISR